MTDEEIIRRLTTVFRDVFMEAELTVTPEMTANDVERWDSLSHVDMVLLVESDFGIRIPTRDVTRMKNVADLIRIIQSKL
jgi:acyl carrier protein